MSNADQNHLRVDQLRRSYHDVSDRDFYAAFIRGAIDGFDAAAAEVQQAFGPREEVPVRTAVEIEAEDGPNMRVGAVRRR